MENLIKWVDFKSTNAGRKLILTDLQISVYEKKATQKSNSTRYVTFSQHLSLLHQDFKKLNVGFIEDKIVIQFNNEKGLNIHLNKSGGSKTNRLRVSSKDFVDIINNSYGKSESGLKILNLTKLSQNTYLITD